MLGECIGICVEDEERILHAFEENPRNSVRRVAHAFGLSRHAVHSALRRNECCIHIIFNGCSNFLRETKSRETVFVKVFVLFL